MPSKEPKKTPSKKKLTEDEKREKKLEKQRTQCRDHLDRELKFSELTEKRIGMTQFKIAEQFTTNKLVSDVTGNIQFTNRLMDQIEYDKEIWDIHREHAGEQHLRVQTIQSKLIGQLTDLFNIFQNSLNEMFESSRKSLVDDFFAETLTLERFLYEQKRYYENYAHANVSLLKGRLAHEMEEYIERKISIDANTVLKKENITKKKIQFEAQICKEIEEIFKHFNHSWPKHRLDEYYAAFNKDENIRAETERLQLKIDKALFEVNSFRKLLKNKSLENELKASRLKFQYKSLINLQSERKINTKESFLKDYEKLKVLACASQKAIKYLKKTVSIIQRIASRLKVCQKYERIEDRTNFIDRNICETESSESFDRKLFLANFDCGNDFLPNEGQNFPANFTCFHRKKQQCKAVNDQSFFAESSTNKASINSEITEKLSKFLTNPYYNFEHFSEDEKEIDVFSTCSIRRASMRKEPSRVSLFSHPRFPIDETILEHFNEKLAIVGADCLALKKEKQKLLTENKCLEDLLAKMCHESGVEQNMKILRLNNSKSIGKIGQIAHEIPQIHDEIIARKCREYHLKHDGENKAT